MQVKIGPSFFSKEFTDYSDWYWAYAREALQNCFDAPKVSNVEVTVIAMGRELAKVTFTNDGEPMTEEVLVNKLLALGETGKNFEGSIGGFGKAKVLLYFAQVSYTIRTGTLLVRGSGGEFTLERDLPYFYGTSSEVVVRGDSVALSKCFVGFCALAQRDVRVKVNEVEVSCQLKKGRFRRELTFGSVYTQKHDDFHGILVRVDGVPMFSELHSYDRCVIVELKRDAQYLTSNRDGLIYAFRSELSEFMLELSTDKRKALKNQEPVKYQRIEGRKLRYDHVEMNEPELVEVSDLVCQEVSGSLLVVRADGRSELVGQIFEVEQERNEFILKNESGLVVPEHFIPGEKFGAYAQKLSRTWEKLLLELYRLFKISGVFSTGFIFSEDVEGQHETGEFGRVYYLNPAVIVGEKTRSFKKRFLLTERDRLLSIAVHEFVHGAMDCRYHNDVYAGHLTHAFALVMKERKRFNRCFS